MSHYVNSEAIFSVIGDDPISDQYDILYSNLAAGSIYDNYVTGSLLTRSTNFFTGKTTLIPGFRGLVFSKLTVDPKKIPLGFLGDKPASYVLQPWRERAGLIKNVKLFTNEERYYDSLTPNLTKMLSILGGKIVKWDLSALGFGAHNSLIFDNDPYNPFEESTGLSPIGFEESFPFEPIFSAVKRSKLISDSFVTTTQWDGSTGVSCNEFKTKVLLIAQLNSGSHFTPPYSYNANYWIENIDNTVGPLIFGGGTAANETSKILFGFGDRNALMKKSDANYYIGKKNLVESRSFFDSGLYYISFGPIVRGWKYGLIDGNPHYTSCIFRRDRYGQFRDMLEQRLNTAFISDEINNPVRNLGTVEKPAIPPGEPVKSQISAGGLGFANLPSLSNLLVDPPVRVNFTRQSYIETTEELIYFAEKPENTWSSNLSTYATSSLPYFDDVSRNRNPITNPPGTVVLSTLADLFGNVTIGA